MKLLFWIISLPLSALILLWAVLNSDFVSFQFLPVVDPLTIPVFILLLAAIGGGFIWGVFAVWLLDGKSRQEKRDIRKKLQRLEKQMSEKPVTGNAVIAASPDLPF